MRRLVFFAVPVLLLLGIGWWRFDSPPQAPTNTPQAPVEQETTSIATVSGFTLLSSPTFGDGSVIPARYTCDGENINPPFSFTRVPPAVKYFAVIMDDEGAEGGVYDHWVAWDIPAIDRTIPENTTAGVFGQSSNQKNAYTGPCPSTGRHTYRWRAYGYTQPLGLPAGAKKNELLDALDGQAIVSAELFGFYERQ